MKKNCDSKFKRRVALGAIQKIHGIAGIASEHNSPQSGWSVETQATVRFSRYFCNESGKAT